MDAHTLIAGFYSAHVLLGLLGPILALAGVVAGVVAYSKSGTQSVWQKNAEAWKARAEERDMEVTRLNGESMDREQQMAELRERLTAIENLPDMSAVLQAGREMAEQHEKRAQERHESLVALMGTIRDSLGEMVAAAHKSADAAERSAVAAQATAKKVNGE